MTRPAPAPRQAPRTPAAPPPHCTRPSGKHLYFGGSVCAECGQQASAQVSGTPAAEIVVDPEAFRDGERLAYDRVLAYLADLPAEAATRTRDQGRGAAHAIRDLVAYVTALRDDLA